jgi:hypothetical protein
VVRASIGEPLAFDTLDREPRPVGIRVAERHPIVVPKIELGAIPM